MDTVGLSFSCGTFLGFPYHLIKGRGMPIISRLHGAAMKSSRVGGFCAMLAIYSDVLAYPFCKLRGEGILTHPGDILACGAASGALLQAHRGLLRASGTALAVGGFFASLTALDAGYKPNNSEINTYAYPHYRPPQHRILAYPDL
ncbi:mitochondrial import inner membrane translocase subunit TIM17-3-like [Silene latifolia]|uniref:mitochondrial import inner membrane translocase subunit TIM17-3-like n=1 Tax=Silene latifolia TaxID=37657 RepID=UPI003D77C41A